MQPRGKKTPAAASQHLGSAIMLGLLTLAFLIIPTLTGKPPVLRHTGDPGQPERHAGELLAQTPAPAPELTPAAEFQGPPVPVAQSSRPAAAQDPWAMPVEGAQEPPWAPNQVFIQKVQLVSILLVAFAGLIWLTLKGINRFLPGMLRPAVPRSKPLMEVLERQNVAPGINLALVRIGEKTVVLGMTEHSVNTLVELSPAEWEAMQRQEEEAESTETPPAAPNPRETYGKIFNHYMSIIPGWGASKR